MVLSTSQVLHDCSMGLKMINMGATIFLCFSHGLIGKHGYPIKTVVAIFEQMFDTMHLSFWCKKENCNDNVV